MKTEDNDLKWKLCNTYFSMLNASNKNSINLEELCSKSKVSYDEATKIILKNSFNNSIFFLKILIAKLDNEALEEFKTDIFEDTISIVDNFSRGIPLNKPPED